MSFVHISIFILSYVSFINQVFKISASLQIDEKMRNRFGTRKLTNIMVSAQFARKSRSRNVTANSIHSKVSQQQIQNEHIQELQAE